MKKIYLLLISTLIWATSSAQLEYYVVEQLDAGSNPDGLNTDVEQPSATGWTDLHAGNSATAAWSSNGTIPFSFVFAAQTFTSYKVSTTGVLTFNVSATTPPASTNMNLPDASIPDNSICVWGIQGSGANDKIRSKTFGTSPNRQHWIQFNSYSIPGATGNQWAYWGIVLEETTNKIYIVDQRTYSTLNPQISLTLGLQLNSTVALEIPGSPDINTVTNGANLDNPTDNGFYSIIPGVQPDFDLILKSFPMPKFVATGISKEITGNLMNMGKETITSMDINYQVNNEAVVTQNVTGLSIAPNDLYTFTHPTDWVPTLAASPAKVKVWTSNLNNNADENPANDTLSASMIVGTGSVQGLVLIEEATNASCGPCATQNPAFDATLYNYIDKIAVIKYHASWPGTDPMYSANTTENTGRISYYGIDGIGVPCATINGKLTTGASYEGAPANVTANPAMIDDAYAIPAFFDVEVSSDLDGNVLTVNTTVTPKVSVSSNSYKLRIAVIEEMVSYDTPPGNNGEMDFSHVLRKMLPNHNGVSLGATTADATLNFTNTYTVNPAKVVPEQLRVVVFVQDDNDKEVFQSVYYDPQVTIGIDNHGASAGFVVYPSPVSDQLILRYKSDSPAEGKIRIQNALGQTVKEVYQQFNAGSSTVSFDATDLETGVYFIIFEQDTQTLTRKFSVVK